jgi:hypothetical protein
MYGEGYGLVMYEAIHQRRESARVKESMRTKEGVRVKESMRMKEGVRVKESEPAWP